MKLIERLALIKAGYTKKEIAALEAEELTGDPAQQPEQEPEPQEPEQKAPEQEPEQDPETGDPEQEEPDYKELYQTAQKQLEAAQKVNIRVDVGQKPKQSDEEKWADIVKSIL